MKYFDTYASNTTASSQNQHIFHSDGETRTGRVFYKITAGGEYNYSLLFSNITDSTFADGKLSHANLVCSAWEICSARIGKCPGNMEFDDLNGAVGDWRDVSFEGKTCKTVAPGEFFATDGVKLSFVAGDYLCLEMTYSGTVMPYHEESIIPIFSQTDGGWVFDKKMPLPGMVGCDRDVQKRIVYLGDSITQGIGTAMNSYTHWNAVLSEKIGSSYSHWNAGIGFARANDTASDGAWMYKAKHGDIIVCCIGANDLLQNKPECDIRRDITRTVDLLARDGRTVVLQTIPPFEYAEHHIPVWKSLNEMIKTELADKVAFVFDVAAAIGQQDEPYFPIYGGHPNAEGCRIWGEKLYAAMRDEGIV